MELRCGLDEKSHLEGCLLEEHGLEAFFNVIAPVHLPGFDKVEDWIPWLLMGNFYDWNELVSRGHEVMPHS
ncbi:MAG: hypothetical protein HN457_03470 [Opitutales bacterium]|nr:hypothetical protein [Opitutales bacterium]MBT6768282.1 hypothetical protein [Opitutales bacterium]